ncbi:MAG: type II secretion system F family protein [Ilumatobacteraceae bacterium]|jgi:Flp pilus assembly protein TadB
MNSDQLLVALLAAMLVCGITLVWSGLHPTHRVGVRPSASRRLDARPAAVGLGCGALVYALSGWLAPALVAAGAVTAAWLGHRQRGVQRDTPERVEAVASWIENVRDVLQAAGQPIGAIGATVESSAPEIRQFVRRLYARLSAGRSAEWALRAFADELDDPLGDLVATGLLIAVTRGGQTEQVLSALADQARSQADRRRIVEAERAPMRHQVLMVSLIMCALLGGLFVFARSDYLDAYDSANGQVVLAAIIAGYVALLARVATLSRFPRPGRFLTVGPDE